MRITDALEAGREQNKAIRREGWGSDMFLFCGPDDELYLGFSGERDEPYQSCISDARADDWVLSPQPYRGKFDPLFQSMQRKEE